MICQLTLKNKCRTEKYCKALIANRKANMCGYAILNYSIYNGITDYNHRNVFYMFLSYGRVVTYVTTDSTLTGVGKYAQDLYLLLAPDSKIFQFLFNRKFLDSFYKQPYTGFKSPLLNYTISGLAFKSGINP